MSLDQSLERYSSLLLSTRYTGTETDFKIQRPNGSDLNFTMLFSRDDHDSNRQAGRDVVELRDRVIGFCPKVYEIDDVEFDLTPDSSLFVKIDGSWCRWESTLENDGAGFMLAFTKSEMDQASYQQNRR